MEVEVEKYHGDNYCQAVISSLADWPDTKCIGSFSRIANETFTLTDNGEDYTLSFTINTYVRQTAYMEIKIIAPNTDHYDQKLEKLKIALKDRLLLDWRNVLAVG